MWNREEKEARCPTLHHVSCVLSVVLMGRETSTLQLLTPLLLTGGKGTDLVIRGDVVLNTLSARSTSTLLRDWICINSSSIRQVPGLAELSYATAFDSVLEIMWYVFLRKLNLLLRVPDRAAGGQRRLRRGSRVCQGQQRLRAGAGRPR
jgi:hypothetical protein